jgi:hypothetical protein
MYPPLANGPSVMRAPTPASASRMTWDEVSGLNNTIAFAVLGTGAAPSA